MSEVVNILVDHFLKRNFSIFGMNEANSRSFYARIFHLRVRRVRIITNSMLRKWSYS